MMSLALGLASFVAPKVGRWIFGDDGEKVAGEIVGIAQQVTGTATGDAAFEAVRRDPALADRLREKLMEFDIRKMEEETKRLQMINETMRAESSSNDPFVRRARPAFLWVTAFSIFVEVIIALVVVIAAPDKIGDLATLYSALSIPQSVAAAMCGVYLKKRSDDKAIERGVAPGGSLLQTLATRFAGKPGA